MSSLGAPCALVDFDYSVGLCEFRGSSAQLWFGYLPVLVLGVLSLVLSLLVVAVCVPGCPLFFVACSQFPLFYWSIALV
jgi:hypothetical protein